MKLDVSGLAHMKWECKYHIVFLNIILYRSVAVSRDICAREKFNDTGNSSKPRDSHERIKEQTSSKILTCIAMKLIIVFVGHREENGFEEIEINGQSWVNVSEYGTVVSGTLDGQIKLYFVTKAGKVLSLPIPHETAEPEEMLFGGGDIIFEYMMQSASLDTDEFGMPKELTSWYCTLLLPTNEIFVRTVQSTLAE